MALIRLALGISAIGWFGLGLNEWLRSRRRVNPGAGELGMPAATSAREVPLRAA
jgi:hypothetical protein